MLLALPIWLMLMSMMVLIGVTGAWRVRGHGVAREAAFRGVWPGPVGGLTRPAEWFPPSAEMEVRSTGLPPVYLDDALSDHVVIRGPRLRDPVSGNELEIATTWWEASAGVIAGRAALNHDAALWRSSGYRHVVVREFPLLDGYAGQHHTRAGSDPAPLRATGLWDLDPAAW